MSSEQHPTYSTAKTTSEIIAAIARAAWWKEHGNTQCPDHMIPTESDLCKYVQVSGGGIVANDPGEARGPRLFIDVSESKASTVVADDQIEHSTMHRLSDIKTAHADFIALSTGDRGPHPLEQLVQKWQESPPLVERETRKDKRILPKIEVLPVHPAREHGMLFGGLTDGRRPLETELPLFPQFSERNRVAILDIVDAAGLPIMAKGKGAPLALRFGIRSLLTVKPQDRHRDSVRLAITLGELAAGLYPTRWRNRDWPKLRNVLLEARNYGMLVNGGRSLWFPWAVRQLPAEHAPSIDELVVIDLAFPPGSAEGPLIDLAALDQLGVESAPRYRAYLAVHSLNWQNGVTRVPVDRARGQWRWARDAAKYPVLTLQERRRLAFGDDDRKHRTTAEIEAAFAGLPGLVIVEHDAKDPRGGITGWRIMPAEVVDLTGENPDLTGENPDLTGENPDLTGENPDLTGENPDLTGENPDLTGEK